MPWGRVSKENPNNGYHQRQSPEWEASYLQNTCWEKQRQSFAFLMCLPASQKNWLAALGSKMLYLLNHQLEPLQNSIFNEWTLNTTNFNGICFQASIFAALWQILLIDIKINGLCSCLFSKEDKDWIHIRSDIYEWTPCVIVYKC